MASMRGASSLKYIYQILGYNFGLVWPLTYDTIPYDTQTTRKYVSVLRLVFVVAVIVTAAMGKIKKKFK